MTIWQTVASILIVLGVCTYFALALGWDGGDPNHPGHNPPGSGF